MSAGTTDDAAAVRSGTATAQYPLDVYSATLHWPRFMQTLVESLVERYGPPHEISEERVAWNVNGPWHRTEVRHRLTDSGGVLPKEILEQRITYPPLVRRTPGKTPVAGRPDPQQRFRELVLPDHCRVTLDRDTLIARCDNEASNIIAVNLAHEIISGKRSVRDAQRLYTKTLDAMIDNPRTPPLAQRPQFLPGKATAAR
ncbi:MAG TPA: hypothetical protein VM491_05950 [Burkholderiaceae bacterium]|nr:hypothetical protein [Burkholderiaceae bacterium]